MFSVKSVDGLEERGESMQKDFHFSMVYVLSRAEGFNQEIAGDIAWASQYVDDCKPHGSFLDSRGKMAGTIITSYDPINPHNFVVEGSRM